VASHLPSEIAYYYPEPYWLSREGGWIKSLLLCFDEVAVLLPSYMHGRHLLADLTLAGPLEERGLLRILEPDTFVDDATATHLTEVIEALVEGGAFDELSRVEHLAELSMSRMGYGALHDIAWKVGETLRERGLAAESADGVSIPMHPDVRSTYLLVLAQLARETGARHGLDLHSVTNGRGTGEGFRRLLELEPMPSRGQVVDFDLQVVSIDLDDVPLDDVLQFKRESDSAHGQYMRNLREFAMDLAIMEEADRLRALTDRQADLEDEARDLRRRALAVWRSPKDVTGFGLGIAGAAWSIATANPIPAVLTAIGAGLEMLPIKAEGSAYSMSSRRARSSSNGLPSRAAAEGIGLSFLAGREPPTRRAGRGPRRGLGGWWGGCAPFPIPA
jgi:hypothetical protein